MKRIHIPNKGPDKGNIPKAIAIGIREASSLKCKNVTIITSAKDNLDSIMVGEFLGRGVSRRLLKNESVRLGDHDVSLTHESVSTVQKKRAPQVGLHSTSPRIK